MPKSNNSSLKQISLTVPQAVYDRALARAKARKKRADGLKLLPSAVLREWLVKGMEADNV